MWVKVEGIIVLGVISGYHDFPKHTCSIYKDGMVSYTRTENSRKGGGLQYRDPTEGISLCPCFCIHCFSVTESKTPDRSNLRKGRLIRGTPPDPVHHGTIEAKLRSCVCGDRSLCLWFFTQHRPERKPLVFLGFPSKWLLGTRSNHLREPAFTFPVICPPNSPSELYKITWLGYEVSPNMLRYWETVGHEDSARFRD